MAAKYDYEGISHTTGEERQPMQRPGRMVATKKLMRIIQDAQIEHWTEEAFADWFADYLEGYGASTAEPMFTTDGEGPVCSWCGSIWPLCGHHHMSNVGSDNDEGNEQNKEVA